MNPFHFKTGMYAEIPGGVIWCKETKVSYSNDGEVRGEIVMEFRMTDVEYEKARTVNHQIPGNKTILLENK